MKSVSGVSLAAFAAVLCLAACAQETPPAATETAPCVEPMLATTDYEPMKMFERFAGRAMRGEGTSPSGQPVVDIAKWEFILGGRALQSTHRLEGGDYGGRTIFFYDEGAEEYVFHYFTTGGFHTVGTAEATADGFRAVEEVLGHPDYARVISEISFVGEEIRVLSGHVKHGGEESGLTEGFVYRPIADPGALF